MSTTTNSPAITTQYELVTATGNIALMMALSASLNAAEVAANTSAEQTFTIQGLLVGDVVSVTKPSLSAGLVIGNARVSAANTLAITYGNLTASPINPAAETYTVMVWRPYSQTITNGLPTSLPTP